MDICKVEIRFDEYKELINQLRECNDNVNRGNGMNDSYTSIYEDTLYGCSKKNVIDNFGYELLLLDYIKSNAKDGQILVEYLSPEKIIIIWEDEKTHIIGRHIFNVDNNSFAIIRKADENGEKNGDYYFAIQKRNNTAYIVFYYPYSLNCVKNIFEGI